MFSSSYLNALKTAHNNVIGSHYKDQLAIQTTLFW